jgi:hypothetical protein
MFVLLTKATCTCLVQLDRRKGHVEGRTARASGKSSLEFYSFISNAYIMFMSRLKSYCDIVSIRFFYFDISSAPPCWKAGSSTPGGPDHQGSARDPWLAKTLAAAKCISYDLALFLDTHRGDRNLGCS